MKTKALWLLLILLLAVTVVAMTIETPEELTVARAWRIITEKKIAGEVVEVDVNNHHSIPRESWDNNNDDNNP